jgi:hypothetical protein
MSGVVENRVRTRSAAAPIASTVCAPGLGRWRVCSAVEAVVT